MCISFFLLSVVGVACGFEHTIVAPKVFRANVTETVVLNLHGYTRALHVSVYLKQIHQGRSNVFSNIERDVPDPTNPIELPLTVNQAELMVSHFKNVYVTLHMEVSRSQHNFRDNIEVLVDFKNGYLFITTDRPAYRPGDTVKVKAAVLDQQMRSYAKLMDSMGDIRFLLKLPRRHGGFVVDNKKITLRDMRFMEWEFEIDSDSRITGEWSVEAEVDELGLATNASFQVDRYVLPTFNVEISLEKQYILTGQPSIRGEIRAQYSYGEKVYGSYYLAADLARHGTPPYEVYRWPETGSRTANIWEGLAEFNINLQSMVDDGVQLQELVDEGATLTIKVSVRDYAGEYESAAVSGIKFTDSPYLIVTSRSSPYFTPGLVYYLKADILEAETRRPIEQALLSVEVNDGELSRRMANRNGEVTFPIATTAADQVLRVTLRTDMPDINDAQQRVKELVVQRYNDPGSDHYLGINLHEYVVEVRRHISAEFRFSPDNFVPPDLRYYIVSRGEIVAHGKTERNNGRGDMSQQILTMQSMVPSARLVAYYMSGRQVVSNSVWFDVVDQCDGQEIEVEVREGGKKVREVAPEQDVTIRIAGNRNSKVHLSAVDRAAYYVYNGSRLTRGRMWTSMDNYDTACSREGGANFLHVFEEAGLLLVGPSGATSKIYEWPTCENENIRKKRSPGDDVRTQASERQKLLEKCDKDGQRKSLSGESCAERKQRVLDNKEDQECADRFFATCEEYGRIRRRQFLGRSGGGVDAIIDRHDSLNNVKRKNFQENWLWETVDLREAGEKEFPRKAPGSISTFEFTTMSMGGDNGFCIGKPVNMRVFKRVFIQLRLPYSLRLHEQANIHFSVFNYGQEDIEDIEIQLKLDSSTICSKFPGEDFQRIGAMDVLRESASSSYFTVMPIKLPAGIESGTIELKLVKRGRTYDHVVKQLRIEERGSVKESSKTWHIENGQEFQIDFNLPNEGFEPGSRKCWIYAYGDPLGPAVEVDPQTGRMTDLENLIGQPGGCGEQNMMRIAPGIYMHKYRLSAGLVEAGDENEDQMVKIIKGGYTRELGHRSVQTNLVAFATWKHRAASTWLNAFVVKVFSQAHDVYADLDMVPICNALAWLLGEQQEDGHFNEQMHVVHREMDGLVEGDLARTAYVAVALLEAAEKCAELQVRVQGATGRAFGYILQTIGDTVAAENVYSLAVTTYAMAVGRRPAMHEHNRKLLARAHHTDDRKGIYWQGGRGRSGNIETTAYALLAQVQIAIVTETYNEELLEQTKKISRWLISQRNHLGGYSSTQDTVVALQAMAEYMTWVYGLQEMDRDGVLTVNLAAEHWDEVLRVDAEENLRFRVGTEVDTRAIGSTINATISADGGKEGSLSYKCTWRQQASTLVNPFNITVRHETIPTPDGNVAGVHLDVAVSKVEDPSAQMSIIAIELPSGHTADTKSLELSLAENFVDGQFDRYEVTNNTVILYVNEIGRKVIHAAFKLKRTNAVTKNAQPAAIHVYDYYTPEIHSTKFYSLEDENAGLRTTCLSATHGEQRMCKCAEGACFTCRTLEQIVTDTQCIGERFNVHKKCATCKKPGVGQCFNAKNAACNSDFVYEVEVNTLPVPKNRFFQVFNATIVKNLKEGDDPVKEKIDWRIFKVRRDCLDACRDPTFQMNEYISSGRRLFIMGSNPEKTTGTDGRDVYTYNLNSEAIIQRIIPEGKCRRVKDKARSKCKSKCITIRYACKLQKDLSNRISQGCG